MSFTENEYAQAVKVIDSERFSNDTFGLIINIVVCGQASELIARLVSHERLFSQSDEEAVGRAAGKLEVMASTAKTLGCILMVNLWPIANELFLHDVCDSIKFWMCDCDADKLAKEVVTSVESTGIVGRNRSPIA